MHTYLNQRIRYLEYLDTKTNLASTILQSTKQKVKVLDFFIFWGSLHFVDQHRNPAKSKNTMPNYRCAPFSMHQVPHVGVTIINLASMILKSTKKVKNF